jgi:hypothetical protein
MMEGWTEGLTVRWTDRRAKGVPRDGPEYGIRDGPRGWMVIRTEGWTKGWKKT